MPECPYTLLSCGMSIDGYIDTATDERLVLSNDAGPTGRRRACGQRRDPRGRRNPRNDNPGCWCVRRRGAPSASPAACRQPRSR